MLSSMNLVLVIFAVAVITLNAVASSRLAPVIAAFFARLDQKRARRLPARHLA